MPLHNDLTVVAVYGHSDGASALPSLQRCVHELAGSRGVLLSVSRPLSMPGEIEWRRIDALTYQQYSIFVMHCLHAFVDTEFCLLVQDDGWVIDGSKFQPHYYDYDYIGAPCHAARVGNDLVQGFRWVGMPGAVIVQNGGFSLRSRRFLVTPSRAGIVYVPHTLHPLMNEDIQLCCLVREAMERQGIRYAPLTVALHFAVEYLGPGIHDGLVLENLLGQHAVTRKLVADRIVACSMSRGTVATCYREEEFLGFLAERGFTITYPDV